MAAVDCSINPATGDSRAASGRYNRGVVRRGVYIKGELRDYTIRNILVQ